MRSSLVAFAMLLVLGPGTHRTAQAASDFPIRGVGKPFFIADAIAVPETPDSVQVDVLWEVPYRELAFRKSDDYYRARYDVAVVFSLGRRQIDGEVWERRVRAKTFDETRDYDSRSKGRQRVMLPRGKYDVRVTVTDRTSRSSAQVQGRLEAEFRSSRIGLSDLRFVRYTEDGVSGNPGRDVPLGQPGHRVRITLHPEPEVSGPVEVRWRFESTHGEEIVDRDTTLVLSGRDLTLEIPVPTDRFAPGLQRLDVRLTGRSKDERERRKTDFHARLTPEWFVLHRDQALEVFETVATDAEVRDLREAKGSDWAPAVRAFWEGRDPTPGNAANEYRETVQLRMETAASAFREPFRPGWETDRGKILLRHGQPDRRTVNEGTFDTPSTELWEYDSPRLVFVFIDTRGNGEFWLRG